jgi:small GTP-binding protein
LATTGKLKRISPDELDRLVDQARVEQWPELVLLGPAFRLSDRVEEWPDSLKRAGRIFHLRTFVEALASRLESLSGLTSLDLRGNGIGAEGAKAIAASLPGLTSLNLAGNGIGAEGAKAIAASLSGLTSLDLTVNRIGDEGARAIAASLRGLTWLNLGRNGIGAEGAKAIAASLPGLTSLNLAGNGIGAEGAKALLDAWSTESRVGQLRHLDLRENGDLGGLLTKEIFETSDGQAIIAAYRSFARAKEKEELQALNELKLLVVGNEAVGKTSLLRYLITGKPRDPSEARTPGIVPHERIEIQGWSPGDCQVRLNIWDFGGQEMMRGTHRYFLTERSLYLLVLEDRRQDDRSIHDWLKTIRNCGRDSPVIVVINKSDEGKEDLRLDEEGLREAYRIIVGAFLRTSCNPGDWAARSIQKLREKIVEVTTRDERLKHVRDGILPNWLRIKDVVSELAERRSVLAHADFVALCREPGDGVEPILDENEQRALLRLLHDLGAIVAHGLERDAPAIRREVNLLDPNWLTGAIYEILDKARSVDQEGEFLRQQLAEWLDPDRYPPERHEFILDMMQDPEIGLCFRLPTPREERYLVPEALPASRRFYGKWPEDALRFRYAYRYLPPGLIPRFIVESHKNLEKSRWRTGVVLNVRDCQVLVLADADQRRVDVQVDGPMPLRRAALNVVLNDLEAVHKLNPEAEPVALVPLPDRPEAHVSYDNLLKNEARFGPDYEFIPDGAERSYQVRELLEGVRLDPATIASSVEPARTGERHEDTETHVVILIHGIRTRALWQDSIRRALERQRFIVQPTNYGYFDLLRFLFPWQPFVGKVVSNITKQIRHTLRINKVATCSIVAHSFGTFVFARILRDCTDLDFKKIIFCGSVVPYKFKFEEYSRRFEHPLVNEVGTRDFWPAIAEGVTIGYGSVGTYGFQRPGVRDRWHNGKSHSAFLNHDFCMKYWVPFLRDGEFIENDEEPESPHWWLWVVSKIKYLIGLVLLVLLWVRLRPLVPI